ncbi:hypothetical protein PHISP_01653 [Aspergillus sp. HF37]|nr:hypothetical protein PHISP_01653 [Aspergillus sp. HF37]
MAVPEDEEIRETVPLTHQRSPSAATHSSDSSLSSAESAFVGEVNPKEDTAFGETMGVAEEEPYRDLEDGNAGPDQPFLGPPGKPREEGRRARRVLWILGVLCVGGWVLAFVFFLVNPQSSTSSASSGAGGADDAHSAAGGSVDGEPVSMDDVLKGRWSPKSHAIEWVEGPAGEDGLMLEVGKPHGKRYLQLKDVRSRSDDASGEVLMETPFVRSGDQSIFATKFWASPDLKKLLLLSDKESNWRHSFTGRYWVFDVQSQSAEPLDPEDPHSRVQVAHWSPNSDAIVFVRGNNMYLRKLSSDTVVPITKDGGKDLFYGVPDWVYEEEVISGNSVTWWSNDGKYVAFLRTNESAVPEYPVQYFLSRPSGKKRPPGLESYPEVRDIKYPKPGAPNPTVHLQFYDVEAAEMFSVDMMDDFDDDDRIVIEVLWASAGRLIMRETNRESDVVKIFLIDAYSKTAQLVRLEDIEGLDGGWVEPARTTRFIPADPANGRPHDGYIDTVIHEGYDHLAYFAPLDNPDPVMLTSGKWEVVDAPSAVDLERGLVFFVATKESPTQRHVYQVNLNGSGLESLTPTSETAYYDVSFSSGTRYALMTYEGPSVPWQAIIGTRDPTYEELIEDNANIKRMHHEYALPTREFQNITVDGYTLQLVERRPPHFDPAKRYPVLFYVYNGPGSQYVDQKFAVDFQSYVASNLGYIVVTLDGRGSGLSGRKTRCIVRGKLGQYESHDQIEAGKQWAAKSYVDETRMAIWGWSYGGYMTLKTLEQDAGQTFQYGMAVAPVTDWRFYDSIYTERYMHTPDHNPSGYSNAAISDMASFQENVRFLVMHGASDDNVHLQSTLVLLDKLDVASVDNYDVHVFPDSDHSILFHNAHFMVYGRLANWLINAFNGEWQRIADAVPNDSIWNRVKRALPLLGFG